MKKSWISVSLAGFVVVVFLLTGGAGGGAIQAFTQAKVGFGFNSPNISGFPTGAAELTGGAYVPGTTFVHREDTFGASRPSSRALSTAAWQDKAFAGIRLRCWRPPRSSARAPRVRR